MSILDNLRTDSGELAQILQKNTLAKQQQEAAMAQMAKEQSLKEQAQIASEQRAQEGIKALKQQGMGGRSIRFGDISVGEAPQRMPGAMLTPAQQAIETSSGKKLADYQTSGGKAVLDQNLAKLGEVEADLSGGKRDWYDRGIGALLGNSPAALGIFGPSEKARRDKARSTALTLAKQTDPNPTEKQIEAIMGQIYDPASSDEANLERIRNFKTQTAGQSQQLEDAAENLRRTGYASIGVGAKPQSQPRSPSTNKPKKVMQGGHTYILNEKTGEYE